MSDIPFMFRPDYGLAFMQEEDRLTAKDWREDAPATAWLWNPWTGKPRDSREIGADPLGERLTCKAPVSESLRYLGGNLGLILDLFFRIYGSRTHAIYFFWDGSIQIVNRSVGNPSLSVAEQKDLLGSLGGTLPPLCALAYLIRSRVFKGKMPLDFIRRNDDYWLNPALPLRYSPLRGMQLPVAPEDVLAREYGKHAFLFNPWSGEARHPDDIFADLQGLNKKVVPPLRTKQDELPIRKCITFMNNSPEVIDYFFKYCGHNLGAIEFTEKSVEISLAGDRGDGPRALKSEIYAFQDDEGRTGQVSSHRVLIQLFLLELETMAGHLDRLL